MNVMEEQNRSYRPPPVQGISTSREKERLSDIFAFKGGKSLPSELTQPEIEGKTPFEKRERMEAEERMRKLRLERKPQMERRAEERRRRRREKEEHKNQEGNEASSSLANTPMIRQIMDEIEERVAFLQEGGDIEPSLRVRIEHEIAQRKHELVTLTSS